MSTNIQLNYLDHRAQPVTESREDYYQTLIAEWLVRFLKEKIGGWQDIYYCDFMDFIMRHPERTVIEGLSINPGQIRNGIQLLIGHEYLLPGEKILVHSEHRSDAPDPKQVDLPREHLNQARQLLSFKEKFKRKYGARCSF